MKALIFAFALVVLTTTVLAEEFDPSELELDPAELELARESRQAGRGGDSGSRPAPGTSAGRGSFVAPSSGRSHTLPAAAGGPSFSTSSSFHKPKCFCDKFCPIFNDCCCKCSKATHTRVYIHV